MKRITIRIGGEERTAATATMDWLRTSLQMEAAQGSRRIQIVIDTADGQRIALSCNAEDREVQWGRPDLRRAVHAYWESHNLCDGTCTAERLLAFFKGLDQLEEWSGMT